MINQISTNQKEFSKIKNYLIQNKIMYKVKQIHKNNNYLKNNKR